MLGCSKLVVLLGAAVAAVQASPVRPRSNYALKEHHFVPRSWERVGPAPGKHVIDLHIGLKQGQFDELERHLYEVSDPRHHRYGQHLSIDEVNELVKPADETVDLVHEWLVDSGIQRHDLDYSPAKDWIKVSLPVEDVERLLDTEYSVYKHVDGSHVVRTPEWSLPLHLHEHVETIQPTNSFFRANARRSNAKPVGKSEKAGKAKAAAGASVADVCDEDEVTPDCLRTFYGTIDYTPQVPGTSMVGLTDYLEEANNRSDVYYFLTRYRPDAVDAAYNFTVDVIDGGDNQQTPNTAEQNLEGKDEEGNLDAQTIIGITYPIPLTAYTTGGDPPFTADDSETSNSNEPYLAWVQYVLNQTSPPQVISTSYGDDEQTVPLSYANSVCKAFAQLGARGVSLLFASGDAGVGDTGYCISNNGSDAASFLPSFPDTCPYVTSVGATYGFSPEVAAYDDLGDDDIFASGGGYSNYFSMPSYQEDVVTSYTSSLGDLYAGLYNTTGRAYPDIAAQGQRYVVTWGGEDVLLDGTSASTPAASAIIALMNDALLAAGKSPLGFLNPWLYSGAGAAAFNDITSGSAVGCGVDGFPAQTGWDAVTGWGSPNFTEALSYLGVS
ncbi:tripeptidyl peptidase-like protein [Saccharata proteae CBS 121410]|uniref:tripeptidyl-peptidase II n=1 Tax=Saccharata proteae CBS 121410 TaxID=1314787 RepID=A0A6A5YCP2_9PEZI|nr:tripeptidyl peptidase-like protein [Saccharata proteae CBS 121410]